MMEPIRVAGLFVGLVLITVGLLVVSMVAWVLEAAFVLLMLLALAVLFSAPFWGFALAWRIVCG